MLILGTKFTMEMCSNFKQSVCEYLSKAKVHRSAELDTVVSNRSHHSGKSYHSRRWSSSSTSSQSKLIEAKTRVAALQVEVAFLKEMQALKIAEKQLEMMKSLAEAKGEERIYEQMNNEELFSTPTCVQTQRLPIFPVSSLLADDAMKDANITSLTTPGSVLTATTTVMTSTPLSATASHLEPASKPFQVSSCSTSAPAYQKPPQTSPLSGYAIGQTRPHYTSPMTACTPGSTASCSGTLVNTVTSGYGSHPYDTPTSAHT